MAKSLVDFTVVVDKLKAARHEQHLTQAMVAEDIGVAQSNISDLETGGSHSLRTLTAYANALGYDIRLELELVPRDPGA